MSNTCLRTSLLRQNWHTVYYSSAGLQQFALPQAFYERPASQAVAKFFRNEDVLTGRKQGNVILTELGTLEIDVAAPAAADGPVVLTMRPEHVDLKPAAGPNQLPATVVAIIYLGTHTQVTHQVGQAIWQAHGPAELTMAPGASIVIGLPARRIWVFAAPQHRG